MKLQSLQSNTVTSTETEPPNGCCLTGSMLNMKPKEEHPKCFSPHIKSALSPLELSLKDITTIYRIPNQTFETKEEVTRKHGYFLESEIASGAFAVIYKVKDINDNKTITCKI